MAPDYIEPPEGFFQKVNYDRLCNLIATQGYGNLTFQKRLEGFNYYKHEPMCNGPAIIAKYKGGEEEYMVQGTHRTMSAIDGIVSGEVDQSDIVLVVIDSQDDLDYLNYVMRNPSIAPQSWDGKKIRWNYTSQDQLPVHTNRGFPDFINELEDLSLDMPLEDYIEEYYEALNR